ncbi:murein transglycosylase C, partial [Pasteurella multocida subsp. multocida str. Anand1_cattle]
MISAYNSGAGAVLRVFDQDRDAAIAKINSLYPEQV